MAGSNHLIAMLIILSACSACSGKPAAKPQPTPAAPAPIPTPKPVAPPAPPIATPEPAPAEAAPSPDKPDVYSGKHKLGVNRVTDMARVGIARFSQQGGEGRVERGAHWLELKGRVEPQGPRKFVLIGTIRGVPDMAWADEAPRERNTEGRFLFEMRHGRPYWRMYELNGRECVCNEDCGNDFCYIDIEQQPIAEPQTIAK